jgi:uncharacterized membrane protein (UPF0127 family)
VLLISTTPDHAMHRRSLLSFAAALAVFAIPVAAPVSAWAQDITKPQPELPRKLLTVITKDGKRHDFNVEMATTPDQETVGLMWRKTVPEDGGMLFSWAAPRRSQMWMRNTVAPLDMLFIGTDGIIKAIAENTVPFSLAVIDSGVPVRATVELAAGVTAKLGITVGDKVEGPAWSSDAG